MISVLTTPRRQDYLRDTLQSIDGAGGASLKHKVVFVDGSVTPEVKDNVLPGWDICPLPSGGPRRSLWRILNYDARTRIGDHIHFDDDVKLCRNAIFAMLAIDVPPEAGFLSFFQQNKNMADTPGFHYLPGRQNWWGTQAIKIPSRSIVKFRAEQTMPPAGNQGDVWLGSQLRGCVLLPSLVRHVGLKTTIATQQGETLSGASIHRAGLHYVGDEFDALLHPFCPPTSVRTSCE